MKSVGGSSVEGPERELEIIRKMLEKTRRESADSSRFFIWMGVLAIVAVILIDRLESMGLANLVIPALVIIFAASGVIGYLIARRMGRTRSWTKSVCLGVWIACGVPGLLAVFLFPVTGVYQWSLVPVIAALLVGTAVFSTGVITGSPLLMWSSLAWWAGGAAMSMLRGTPRAAVMITVILFGWIMPGVLMRRRYGSKRTDHGA